LLVTIVVFVIDSDVIFKMMIEVNLRQ
jgi:hypothetical protein